MRLRFLRTTASGSPGYPFQPGQIIDLPRLAPEHETWIAEGAAELVRADPAAETATAPAGERAEPRPRKPR